jgi:hypothetical protein
MLFLARHPGVPCRPAEIVNQMQPTVITQAAAAQYITLFEEHGLVAEQAEGVFVYRPASPELEEAMAALVQAYNERPVTLIRVVYEVANSKTIRSFADAFKFKKK